MACHKRASISTSKATSKAREVEIFDEEMEPETDGNPAQSRLLQEALKGAIEHHKEDPAFVPSITQAIRSTFGPYRFKGFGYSCMKPLNKISSVGLGLRIPVSPCFPQYDANVGLPPLVEHAKLVDYRRGNLSSSELQHVPTLTGVLLLLNTTWFQSKIAIPFCFGECPL